MATDDYNYGYNYFMMIDDYFMTVLWLFYDHW